LPPLDDNLSPLAVPLMHTNYTKQRVYDETGPPASDPLAVISGSKRVEPGEASSQSHHYVIELPFPALPPVWQSRVRCRFVDAEGGEGVLTSLRASRSRSETFSGSFVPSSPARARDWRLARNCKHQDHHFINTIFPYDVTTRSPSV
jgi:hypothetical protein